jgi:hypothetical protein
VNSVGMHRITLVGFPVELFLEARRHNEALLREFSFICATESEGAEVPSRLLNLGRQLRDRFYGLNDTLEDQVAAAAARGDVAIDLEVQVVSTVRQAAITLGELFDEADAYCRSGDLLTLAESSEMHDFRTWYIEECLRQLDGAEPVPWPEWNAPRVTTRP